jgi:hypothetical protein
MNQAVAVLLGAIFGAILSGVGLESYKRHRDRQGTASAIAGEIFAILQMSAKRNYVSWFHGMLSTLDSGTDLKVPDILRRPIELDPVISKYLDRIGLLGEDLPERIVTFYHQIMGIRSDLARLADGKFDGVPNASQIKANLIREDLALWDETVALGNTLRDELRAIAIEPWGPVATMLTIKRALVKAPPN